MSMRRREWLQAVGCGAAAASSASGLGRLAFASEPGGRGAQGEGALVVLFLRGGADALHLAAPVDDPDYVAARTAPLRIAEGGTAPGLRLPHAFAPDRDCRLHPEAAPLLELFHGGHAQLLHACGLPDATRSHFAAQELAESGLRSAAAGADGGSATPGWLAPLLPAGAAAAEPRRVACVSTSAQRARSLQGVDSVLNLPGELHDAVSLPGGGAGRLALEALYGGASGQDAVARLGRQTLQRLQWLESRMPRIDGKLAAYGPPPGVRYDGPDRRFSAALQTVAQLLRLDVGLRVACVDLAGWDTHENQAARLAPLVRQWAANLRALFDDMQAAGRPLTVVAMSEFGRRLRGNGSGGTDHGHGGALWVLDSRARALLPPTDWPGLAVAQLDQGADLRATRHFRPVLEFVARQALAEAAPA